MMNMDRVVEELKKVLGEEYVSIDTVDLVPYGKDFYTPVAKAFLGTVAEAGILVLPSTTEEVAAVVRIANKYKIPITPFALGTNMASNATPSRKGAITMDLRRMKKVKVNPETLTATIQPAVSFGRLEYILEQYGLKAPSHIGSGAGGFIGNWVQANVRPFNCEGGMTDPVVTAEIVLPTGEIMRTGSMAMKDEKYMEENPFVRMAFGPDIVGLWRGSIGAFGIVTSVTIRVHKKGEVEKRLKIGFPDLETLVKVSDEIQYNRIGIAAVANNREGAFSVITSPTERELMDKEQLKKLKDSIPEWVLMLNLEGTREQVEAEEKVVKKILKEYGGDYIEFPQPFKKFMERFDSFASHHGGAQIFALAEPTSMIALWCQTPRKYIVNFYNETVQKMKELDIRHVTTNEPFLGRWFLVPHDRGVTNLVGVDLDFTELDEQSYKKAMEFLVNYLPIMEKNYGVIPLVMGPLADLILMPSYTDLLKALKKLIDPNNIMNPDRLIMGMEKVHLTAEIKGYLTGLLKAKKMLEEHTYEEALELLNKEIQRIKVDETRFTTTVEGYETAG
ncbi:MAG: FAD-binding oxidoreductase [Candidatus Jordarchaeaceae archaeon]